MDRFLAREKCTEKLQCARTKIISGQEVEGGEEPAVQMEKERAAMKNEKRKLKEEGMCRGKSVQTEKGLQYMT